MKGMDLYVLPYPSGIIEEPADFWPPWEVYMSKVRLGLDIK